MPDRPPWCPFPSCTFLHQSQDAICAGRLPQPEDHRDDFNTHRLCFQDDTGGPPMNLQVNRSDLFWIRLVCEQVRPDADRHYREESLRRRRDQA